MSFYLDKIIIYNNAPFENLSLDFSKDGVNVLTGLNGRGKTTIISYIVDALVEISKEAFYNEYKDKSNSYYRLSSSVYSLDISKPSLVYIRFKNDDDFFDHLYRMFNIKRVSAARMINSKGDGRGVISEIMISNVANAY